MKTDEDLPKDVVLREHEYDGIQEYDQKLPNWWLFTFYIAIAWFIVAWLVYYQLPFHAPTDHERLSGELAYIEQKKKEELDRMMAKIDDDALFEMSRELNHVNSGQAIFETKCAACHGVDLSATLNGINLPGVPLNDEEWLYGGKPLEIMNIVTNGSPDITKGMVAWKGQLAPTEIAQVVAYILSHHES